MKLTQVPNFRVEDFQSEQSWIGRLFGQLNPFIQAVNQVFDSNVDFATNIKSITRDLNLSGFQKFDLQWPYRDYPPLELSIVKASQGSQKIPTILILAWSYDAGSSVITIHNILEVTSDGNKDLSGQYQLTIRASV